MEAPPPSSAVAQSALQTFLTERFPADRWTADAAEGRWDDSQLINHCLESLGVVAKVEENLYSFKYDQILCTKWLPHVCECRGIILARFARHWAVLSRPFDKFFNQFESGCPVMEEQEFDRRCTEFFVVEKTDGTCLQLWLDRRHKDDPLLEAQGVAEMRGRRCSTLGSITPDTLFSGLLYGIADPQKLHSAMDPAYTYLLELCCQANRVVTAYPSDRAYLLAARHVASGAVLGDAALDALVPRMGLLRPFSVSFASLGLASLKDTKAFVEREALRPEKYGAHPEGFVIYWRGAPLCKIKNKRYLEKHGLCTGDLLYQRNIVIGQFFDGTLDDIYDVFSPPIKAFVEELREKVKGLMQEVEALQRTLFPATAPLQRREYVERVKASVPPKFAAFFLSNFPEVTNPHADIASVYFDYLKKQANYQKLAPFWKVPEILEREKAQGYKTPEQPRPE